jgi:hypothetical protein
VSTFDDRVRNLLILIAIVLAIPLLLFLVSEFNINPFASPIIGTWEGSIYYNNSIDLQVNAIFVFASNGNCSINMSRVYLTDDGYVTQIIDQAAQWKTAGGNLYLIYDNYDIPLDIETYSGITGSTTRLYLQNETTGGMSSPLHGYLIQYNT